MNNSKSYQIKYLADLWFCICILYLPLCGWHLLIAALCPLYRSIIIEYGQIHSKNMDFCTYKFAHRQFFFFFTNMDLEVRSLRPLCCFKFQSSSKVEEESEWLICINCKAELFSQTETAPTNVFSHIENTTCSLIAGRRGKQLKVNAGQWPRSIETLHFHL